MNGYQKKLEQLPLWPRMKAIIDGDPYRDLDIGNPKELTPRIKDEILEMKEEAKDSLKRRDAYNAFFVTIMGLFAGSMVTLLKNSFFDNDEGVLRLSLIFVFLIVLGYRFTKLWQLVIARQRERMRVAYLIWAAAELEYSVLKGREALYQFYRYGEAREALKTGRKWDKTHHDQGTADLVRWTFLFVGTIVVAYLLNHFFG